MSPRLSGLLIAVLLLSITLAWGIEPKAELYVLNVKPPSIAVVNTSEMKLASDIPLPGEPTYALMGPDNKHLYVLLDGLFHANGLFKAGLSKLAVIDVASRQVVKTIPLAWNTRGMSLSKDNRYLLCVNDGKGVTKKALPEESGSVTIIDTNSNAAVATLTAGRLGLQAVYNSNLSRIAVFSQGEPSRKKNQKGIPPRVTVFDVQQETPLAAIDLERAQSISMSSDEKYLYVLDGGIPDKKPAKHKNAVVSVIDLAEPKIVKTHEVATYVKELTIDPETNSAYVLAQASVKDDTGRIFRFNGPELAETSTVGSNPQFLKMFGRDFGNFVMTGSDIRKLPAAGPVGSSFIALNRAKGAPAADAAAADRYLGGVPGEVLHLPQQGKLVTTVRNNLGAPTSKVAIVDLKDNKVQSVVTTGRGSVKFGKFMGALALSVAMSSLSYYANYSIAVNTGQPYFFYNVYSFRVAPPNLELTASPDGKFVYALNSQTNDVTVIDIAAGKTLDKIAVGGSCRRVALAPGGKFVYSFTPGQFDLIDVATNKKHQEHAVTKGKLNAVHEQQAEKRLLVLTSESVQVWDAEKGSLASTITGFHNPHLVVEPRRDAR
jgi:YVTN family beta-propeller protein